MTPVDPGDPTPIPAPGSTVPLFVAPDDVEWMEIPSVKAKHSRPAPEESMWDFARALEEIAWPADDPETPIYNSIRKERQPI